MAICTLQVADAESISHTAEKWLIEKIRKEHPEWVEEDGSSPTCNEYYKILYRIVENKD